MTTKAAKKPNVALRSDAKQRDVQSLTAVMREHAERLKEPLRIYEPLPFQDQFHKCRAREVLLQKGNRSGGSVAGFVEDARCVLGLDPYGKYPDKGIVVCIGYGEPHIGTIIWNHLFEPGMGGNFQIVQDKHDGSWRRFRPWEPDRSINGKSGDWGREGEIQLSEPLIPSKYFVEEPAWTNRRERIFSIVRVKTAKTEYEIRAYNSNGDWRQAQGFNANLVHIDEDIANPGWYYEMVARTNFVQGRIIWTAKPADENDVMATMAERGEEEAEQEKPRTVVFVASPDDNPYYSEKEKADDQKHWKSMGEEVFEQRYQGKFTTGKLRMYPTFNRVVHNVARDDCPAMKVHEALKANQWVPPRDWCCYATIDPGHQVCAVLFWGIPPKTLWTHPDGHAVVYDELYLKQASAHTFGKHFAEKAKDQYWENFIIDAHGAALRDIGSGLTPREQYSSQLKKFNISSARSRFGFHDGCDDPESREFIVRDWLRIREDGTTRVMIVSDRVPNLVREMENFKHKVDRSMGLVNVREEGDRRRNTHAVECFEYGCAHKMEYVRPKISTPKVGIVDRILSNRRLSRLRRRKEFGQKQSHTFGARGTT